MISKIFFSTFFLGLNLLVFWHLYWKIRFRIIEVLLILALTISLWIVNNNYLFVSSNDFILLIVFSYSQIIVWHFLIFIFMKNFDTNKNRNIKVTRFYFASFLGAKRFIISLLILIILSLNQLSIIWGLNI